MRSLIDIMTLTVEEIDELIATAEDIIENPKKYSEKCHGKSWQPCSSNPPPVPV